MTPPACDPDVPEIPELWCLCGTSISPGAAALNCYSTPQWGLLTIVSPHHCPLCSWSPPNTSRPVSNSCLLARNSQSQCCLHLNSCVSMSPNPALFPWRSCYREPTCSCQLLQLPKNSRFPSTLGKTQHHLPGLSMHPDIRAQLFQVPLAFDGAYVAAMWRITEDVTYKIAHITMVSVSDGG